MNQTIWIARHGSRLDFIDLNWFNQAQRPYDPPLALEGEIQAQQLARTLKSATIVHIFASPFLRTVQTAHIVADILDLPLKLEAGLSEWLNPDWMSSQPETLPLEILAQSYSRIDTSYKSVVIPQYPETEIQLNQRVSMTTKYLIENFSEDILIIGHAASVAGSAKTLVPETPEIKTSFCCLIQIQRTSQGWKMLLNGDTSHIK
mgnify:CR=1 FL=1